MAYHLVMYSSNPGAWLPPRARRRLSADLAQARAGAYTGVRAELPRGTRRSLGAGPWPKLRRRADRARRAS